jgi:phage terminase small subunit
MARQVKLPNGLTQQQMKFCQAYLTNGMNGSKAAEAAGYSYKEPRKIATRLLNMPEIKNYLDEQRKLVCEKLKNCPFYGQL